MSNVLSIVRGDMVRHKVNVLLPGELEVKMLYLLMISAETNTVEDFQKTFSGQITHLHLRLAKKIWGDKKKQNTYGVFFDDEMKMVFAFNRLFADFQKKGLSTSGDGLVVYRDLDELIEKAIGDINKPQVCSDFEQEPGIGPVPHFPPYHHNPFHGGHDILVRYSIPDPSGDKPE